MSEKIDRRKYLKYIGAVAGAGAAIAAGYGVYRYTRPPPTVNLKWIAGSYPQVIEEEKKMCDEWHTANPTTTISLERVGFADLILKVVAAEAAEAPYDIIEAVSTSSFWALQEKDIFAPMTDIVDELGEDYFLPGVLTPFEGEHLGIPSNVFTSVIYYRTDLFEEKGLNPPRTWDELLTAAEALTEDTTGDGKIDRWGMCYACPSNPLTGIPVISWILSNGGHIIDENGDIVFDSPEVVQVLEFVKELYQYSPPGSPDYGWSDLRTLFFSGKTAMSWYAALTVNLDSLEPPGSELRDKTGIIPFPTRTVNQKPVCRTSKEIIGVSKKSNNIGTVKEVVKYLMRPENNMRKHLAVPTNYIPTVQAVIDSQEFWDDPVLKDLEDLYREYIDIQIKYGLEQDVFEHKGIMNPKTGLILEALLVPGCIQDVLLNDVSPEDAASKWADEMRKTFP